MGVVFVKEQQSTWEKKKMLVTSIFSLPHIAFKSVFPRQGRYISRLYGNLYLYYFVRIFSSFPDAKFAFKR